MKVFALIINITKNVVINNVIKGPHRYKHLSSAERKDLAVVSSTSRPKLQTVTV
uniref:Uncharacterized protein n=1 Tax=Octopus bimaculoides TaxID=37653 RepID=A0A0L8FFC9_OCTBM